MQDSALPCAMYVRYLNSKNIKYHASNLKHKTEGSFLSDEKTYLHFTETGGSSIFVKGTKMETLYVDTNKEVDEIVRNYNLHTYKENLILNGMTLIECNNLIVGVYIGQLIEVREILLKQRVMHLQQAKKVISESKLIELLIRIEKEKSTIVEHAGNFKKFDKY